MVKFSAVSRADSETEARYPGPRRVPREVTDMPESLKNAHRWCQRSPVEHSKKWPRREARVGLDLKALRMWHERSVGW